MLVLSRKTNQEILINGNIKVSVLKIKGNVVRLGIEAPSEVSIKRGELVTHEIDFPNVETTEGSDDSASFTLSIDASAVKASEVSEEPAGYQLLPLHTEESLVDCDSANLANDIQTQFPGTLNRGLCCESISCQRESA